MSIREQSIREHGRAKKVLDRYEAKVKNGKGLQSFAAAVACVPYLRKMLKESETLREAELKERQARQVAEARTVALTKERDALRRQIDRALGALAPAAPTDGLAAVGLGDARD